METVIQVAISFLLSLGTKRKSLAQASLSLNRSLCNISQRSKKLFEFIFLLLRKSAYMYHISVLT